MRTLLLLVCAWVALPAAQVQAHPLAPALLHWQAIEPGHYTVLWRSSVLRVRGSDVWPEWPADCTAQPLDDSVQTDGEAIEQRWSLYCTGGLAGRTLQVRGLEAAGITVVVRVTHGQLEQQTLLDARQPSWQVPVPDARSTVFGRYLWLGVDHLWRGPDHLLFVIGLVLLVGGLRRLLWTITAFTMGHSLTLGLSVLDRIRVPEAVAEWGIALSLLLLAVTLVRPSAISTAWLARYPATMAAGFGLIHGLGFAGALREVGLPPGEIPLALLAFNLGIELGQISLVALLLVAARVHAVLRRSHSSTPHTTTIVAYAIGTLATYWLLVRSALMWPVL